MCVWCYRSTFSLSVNSLFVFLLSLPIFCCSHFITSRSFYPLLQPLSLDFPIDLVDIPWSHSCGDGFRWHLPHSHSTAHLNLRERSSFLQRKPRLWSEVKRSLVLSEKVWATGLSDFSEQLRTHINDSSQTVYRLPNFHFFFFPNLRAILLSYSSVDPCYHGDVSHPRWALIEEKERETTKGNEKDCFWMIV